MSFDWTQSAPNFGNPRPQWEVGSALAVQPPLPATEIDVSQFIATPLPQRALLTLWNPEMQESVIFDPPPRELRTSAGSTTAEVSLDAFGSVSRPTGRQPTAYSFSGVFYGAKRYDTPIVFPDRYRMPNDWRWLLEEFHRLQADRVSPLEFHLEGWDIPPFTKPVYIASMEFAYRGGSGDLQYSITLTEHRHVQVGVEGAVDDDALSSDASEGGPDIPATILVREADTLSELAQHYLGDGTRWPEIAELNGLTDEDVEALQIGRELALPGGQPEAPDRADPGWQDYPGLEAEDEEA